METEFTVFEWEDKDTGERRNPLADIELGLDDDYFELDME